MKNDKAARRIDQIIESTFRCIAEKGYGNVTMNSIAEYSNLSKGAINYYFKNKEDILIGVLNELDKKLLKILSKIKETTNSKFDLRYRLGLSGGFKMIRDDMTLMYVLIDFLSQSSKNVDYLYILKGFLRRYREMSSNAIESGMDAGIYKKNITPENIAVIIIANIIGIGLQKIIDGENIDFDEISRTAEDVIITYIAQKERR